MLIFNMGQAYRFAIWALNIRPNHMTPFGPPSSTSRAGRCPPGRRTLPAPTCPLATIATWRCSPEGSRAGRHGGVTGSEIVVIFF